MVYAQGPTNRAIFFAYWEDINNTEDITEDVAIVWIKDGCGTGKSQ